MIHAKAFCSLLFLLPISAAAAQATAAAALVLGGVDKLLDRIDAVTLYSGGQINPSPQRTPWSKSFGVEFGFHLGDGGKPLTAEEKVMKALGAKPKEVPWEGDISGVTVKKHYEDGKLVALDSEIVSTKRPQSVEQPFSFDLGIAYGQLDGINMTSPYEIRGYARELPALSSYVTWKPFGRIRGLRHVAGYVGARVGIITLQDAQLFTGIDSLPIVSLSASTFEIGVPLGAEFGVPLASGLRFTLEASHMRRKFNSLSYNPAKGFPAGIPHTLDLSGWSWDVGISFSIPKKQ